MHTTGYVFNKSSFSRTVRYRFSFGSHSINYFSKQQIAAPDFNTSSHSALPNILKSYIAILSLYHSGRPSAQTSTNFAITKMKTMNASCITCGQIYTSVLNLVQYPYWGPTTVHTRICSSNYLI